MVIIWRLCDNLMSAKTLGFIRQFYAAVVVNLGVFGLGCVIGWTCTGLESLRKDFTLSLWQESWIASINHLGGVAACIIGGFILDKVGRKNSAIVFAIPSIVGWLYFIYAKDVAMLYSARFLLGFSTSYAGIVGPVLVSEIAETKVRGVLSNFYGLFLTGGMLFSYIVGSLVTDWQAFSLICMVVPVLMFLIIWPIKESPRHLLQQGKERKGMDSFCWYRGVTFETSEAVQTELDVIKDGVEKSKELKKPTLKSILTSEALKPLLMCITLAVLSQLSGFAAIVAFTGEIFANAGLDSQKNTMSIIFGICQVFATTISCLLVDQLGRKPLLIMGQIWMFFSLVGLGTFFSFKTEMINSNLGYIPLVCMTVYIIAYNIGIGPICTTVMGELLPQNIRGVGFAISTALLRIAAFAISFGFSSAENGSQYCFWIFAGMCLVGLGIVIFWIPETKGKSLEEIKELFKK